MTMSAFLLFLTGLFCVDGQSIYKKIKLDPSNKASAGATSAIISSYISVADNMWWINTTAAIGSADWATQFDIAFSVDSSWGFHPSNMSTLSFTINLGTNDSTYLIVSFSENDSQWFSILLALDHDQSNVIYPSNNPYFLYEYMASGNINDAVTSSNGSRSSLFGGNTYDSLESLSPSNCTLEWPVTITLDNDPTSNLMTVTMSDAACNQWYTYDDHFVGDNGLDVFLSMNSPYDSPIPIKSVEFEYNLTEYTPTDYPTVIPTDYPTGDPTSSTVLIDEVPIGGSASPTTSFTAQPTSESTLPFSEDHSVCDWT